MPLADLSADPTVQTLLSGRTVTAETGFLGARRLVASAMVPGVAWHLVVSDDPAALDAAVLPLVGGLASVSLAFLVLALVAASLLARAFRRLARSRAALATANAELAAPYGVAYEGDLVSALDALQPRYDEIVAALEEQPFRIGLVADRYQSLLETVAAGREPDVTAP